jgi:catalase
MAVRFHLADGTASDLIATTLGEFFVRNVEDFFEFAKVAKLEPYQRQHWLLKIVDFLQLKVPPRNPYPNETQSVDAGALVMPTGTGSPSWAYSRSPRSARPESYARATLSRRPYLLGDGARWRSPPVRFSWQPVAGVRNIGAEEEPRDKYLFNEIEDRLKRWPARFMLMMTIGEEGDALDDPTKPWPGTRIRIAMGTLTLTEVPKDQEAAGERISFQSLSPRARHRSLQRSHPRGPQGSLRSLARNARWMSLQVEARTMPIPSDERPIDRFVDRLPQTRVFKFLATWIWCLSGRGGRR